MRGLAWMSLGVLAAGGCTTVDKYSGLDGPPGGYVVGSSPFQRTMADLNPFQSQYTHQWALVWVVAPPGATQCRIADQSPFMPDGPKAEGRPDAKREVMLTYDAFAETAAFECKTPDGVKKRTVKAVVYEMPVSKKSPRSFAFRTQVKPPLVHIDPNDPEAERRWTELAAELCPEVSERASGFACKPGMLEKLKAEDLTAG